jgi:hypothetical protein
MDRDRFAQRFKWHIVFTGSVLFIVILLTFFTDIFQTSGTNRVPQTIWLLCALIVLISVLTMLAKIVNILDVLRQTDAKLDQISNFLEKNNTELKQINQNTRLSETAKAIAFRDAEMQALRETVYDKLHRQDFPSTYAIIDEIAYATIYKELAKQLRAEADGYRNATDAERINQVISHIDKLLDSFEWAKAGVQIEILIKAEPNSEPAKAMRQKLMDKKQQRKKILLTAWDDAVKRQATDEGLEILRELDQYLTPNEGLALQEAARDVFRTKLHNLGVAFTFAVSEKQWAKALETGHQIIRDFPNSKMAEEIRERMDALTKRAKETANS